MAAAALMSLCEQSLIFHYLYKYNQTMKVIRTIRWLGLCLLLGGSGHAVTLSVLPGTSIQAKIDLAQLGDIVAIFGGTYNLSEQPCAVALERRLSTFAAGGFAFQSRWLPSRSECFCTSEIGVCVRTSKIIRQTKAICS